MTEKKFSQFYQKYRMSATASYDTTVVQMTKMSQLNKSSSHVSQNDF